MRGRVHRRGAGWAYTVDLGRDPASGKRRQKMKGGFRTRDEAEVGLDDVLGKVRAGLPVPSAKLTVGTFLTKRWLPAISATVAPNTADSYTRMVETHLEPRIGNISLTALDGAHLTALYGELSRSGRKDGKGGLSARTVRLAHVTMHRALRDALRWGLVARNAADAADVPRQPHREAPTWTPEQVRTFLTAPTKDRWRPAWILAATTGLRRGELAALRWRDIDLDARRLSVRQAVAVVGGHMHVGAPKTAQSRRSVALDLGTVDALKAWRRRQLEERVAMGAGWQDRDDRVFTLHDGRPVSPDVLTRAFERAVDASKLPKLSLHGLRHSHATAALVAGVPLKVVADRLGHSSIRVTGDVYSHVVAGLDEDAANVVGALMLGHR
jgi:integrase